MEKKIDYLAEKAVALGASEAKILNADEIVFDSRAYLKCRFGCNRWGKYWTCPPNLDISPEQFMDAFAQYHSAVIIKTTDPQVGQKVTLEVEKEAMLTMGCSFAFAMVLCVQCEECAYPDPCKYPHLARPSMDAYGIDIGKTVAPLGFEVALDPDGKMLPAWYSMVLID